MKLKLYISLIILVYITICHGFISTTPLLSDSMQFNTWGEIPCENACVSLNNVTVNLIPSKNDPEFIIESFNFTTYDKYGIFIPTRYSNSSIFIGGEAFFKPNVYLEGLKLITFNLEFFASTILSDNYNIQLASTTNNIIQQQDATITVSYTSLDDNNQTVSNTYTDTINFYAVIDSKSKQPVNTTLDESLASFVSVSRFAPKSDVFRWSIMFPSITAVPEFITVQFMGPYSYVLANSTTLTQNDDHVLTSSSTNSQIQKLKQLLQESNNNNNEDSNELFVNIDDSNDIKTVTCRFNNIIIKNAKLDLTKQILTIPAIDELTQQHVTHLGGSLSLQCDDVQLKPLFPSIPADFVIHQWEETVISSYALSTDNVSTLIDIRSTHYEPTEYVFLPLYITSQVHIEQELFFASQYYYFIAESTEPQTTTNSTIMPTINHKTKKYEKLFASLHTPLYTGIHEYIFPYVYGERERPWLYQHHIKLNGYYNKLLSYLPSSLSTKLFDKKHEYNGIKNVSLPLSVLFNSDLDEINNFCAQQYVEHNNTIIIPTTQLTTQSEEYSVNDSENNSESVTNLDESNNKIEYYFDDNSSEFVSSNEEYYTTNDLATYNTIQDSSNSSTYPIFYQFQTQAPSIYNSKRVVPVFVTSTPQITKYTKIAHGFTFNAGYPDLKLSLTNLANNFDILTLSFPRRAYQFSGNFTSCKIEISRGNVITSLNTQLYDPHKQSIGSFFELSTPSISGQFLKHDDITLYCPNGGSEYRDKQIYFGSEYLTINGISSSQEQFQTTMQVMPNEFFVQFMTFVFVFLVFVATIALLLFLRFMILGHKLITTVTSDTSNQQNTQNNDSSYISPEMPKPSAADVESAEEHSIN